MTECRSRDRGAVLPIVALALSVLMLMAAFTIDLGRQSLRRREVQAAVDAISLDLSRLIDGRSADEIRADASWDKVRIQAAFRNGMSGASVAALIGHYDATADVFTEYSGLLGSQIPDAVQVTGTDTVSYMFARVIGRSSGSVQRSAVAQQTAAGSYTLGSALAEAAAGNDALLNPIVSGLLGSTVSLNGNDYQGLAAASASLTELAAGRFSSVDDMLNTDMALSAYSTLAADALRDLGDVSDATTFDVLSAATANDPDFRLSDVLRASPGSTSAENVGINLFTVLLAAAQFANGTTAIDFTAAVPPVTVPGIANVSLSTNYLVTDPPVVGYGRVGSSTAPSNSARLRTETSLTVSLVDAPVPGFTDVNVTGDLTLLVRFAGADAAADLARVECVTNESNSVIDVDIVLATMSTGIDGALGTLGVTVAGVGDGAIDLTADDAESSPAASPGSSLTDIRIGETATAPGNNIDFGAVLDTSNVDHTATTTVDADQLEAGILDLLNPALSAVTSAMYPALAALGVTTSTADVTNIDVECGTPALAD
jgi:uncharacterized membrane protein